MPRFDNQLNAAQHVNTKGGHSKLRVTPLGAPEDATSIDEAKLREEFFLRRFEEQLSNCARAYQPIERKFYNLAKALGPVQQKDPFPELLQLLKGHDVFDLDVLNRLPHSRSKSFQVYKSGLFRKKAKLQFVAQSLSPTLDLAKLGVALKPLGKERIQDVMTQTVLSDDVYYVIGIMSTVGWTATAKQQIPRGDNYSVLLIEQRPSEAWSVEHSLPSKMTDLLCLYDPEDDSAKVARALSALQQLPELKIPGGHIESLRFLSKFEIAREHFEAAFRQFRQDEEFVRLVTVGDLELIKRDRF